MRPKKRPVGRPRVGNVKLQFALSPQADNIIRAISKRHKISRSDFIELLVRYADLPETVIWTSRARLQMEKPVPKPKTKPAKPMPKPAPSEVPGNPAQI